MCNLVQSNPNEIVLNAVQGPSQLEPCLLSEESGSASLLVSVRNSGFSDESTVSHKTLLPVPTEAVVPG